MKEYEILGQEYSVYPGHPITIAYIIMHLYPSFEEATSLAENSNYDKAVANIDVPGAGGNVYSALDFLAALRMTSWDTAIGYADQSWEIYSQKNSDSKPRDGWIPEINGCRCTPAEYYADRWKRGQEQADRIKPLLKEKIKTWLTRIGEVKCGKIGCNKPATQQIQADLLYHACDEHYAEIDELTKSERS